MKESSGRGEEEEAVRASGSRSLHAREQDVKRTGQVLSSLVCLTLTTCGGCFCYFPNLFGDISKKL